MKFVQVELPYKMAAAVLQIGQRRKSGTLALNRERDNKEAVKYYFKVIL